MFINKRSFCRWSRNEQIRTQKRPNRSHNGWGAYVLVFYKSSGCSHGVAEGPFVGAAGAALAFGTKLVDVSLGAHDIHVGLAHPFTLAAEDHIVCKAVVNAAFALLFFLRRQRSGDDVFIQSHMIPLLVR